MRTSLSLACVLTTSLLACGGGGGPADDDDTPTPDSGTDLPPPPDRGFRITSPDITIEPGQEITYCYYFRTPNTEKMAVKQWKSEMTPGSHHMIMFTTTNDAKPVGTVSSQECGFGASLDVPRWTYSAQTPSAELQLPADDGGGKPLAQEVAPNTAGFFQMHYLNATDEPIQAHVVLDAYALEANDVYTPTAPYVTFKPDIKIPADAVGDVETASCSLNTLPNAKFWMMSTHAHKQAVKTRVLDGTTEVFASTDWEHPGARLFMTPSEFYSFSSGAVTYECTYDNTGSNHSSLIETGDSAEFDEMCMASGYYFPATKAAFCYGSQPVNF